MLIPENEEVAARFLLEFVIDQLSQDPENIFWWFPRLMVIERLMVGMCGFKSPPDDKSTVEMGMELWFQNITKELRLKL